jgi:hypothetical protein
VSARTALPTVLPVVLQLAHALPVLKASSYSTLLVTTLLPPPAPKHTSLMQLTRLASRALQAAATALILPIVLLATVSLLNRTLLQTRPVYAHKPVLQALDIMPQRLLTVSHALPGAFSAPPMPLNAYNATQVSPFISPIAPAFSLLAPSIQQPFSL